MATSATTWTTTPMLTSSNTLQTRGGLENTDRHSSSSNTAEVHITVVATIQHGKRFTCGFSKATNKQLWQWTFEPWFESIFQ